MQDLHYAPYKSLFSEVLVYAYPNISVLDSYISHRLAGSYRDGEIGVSDEHLASIPGLVLGNINPR